MIGQLCVSCSAAGHRSSLFKQINFSLSTAARERRVSEPWDCVWVGSPQYVYSGFRCSSQLCCYPLAFSAVWHFKRPRSSLVTSIPCGEMYWMSHEKPEIGFYSNQFLFFKLTNADVRFASRAGAGGVFLCCIFPTLDTMGK